MGAESEYNSGEQVESLATIKAFHYASKVRIEELGNEKIGLELRLAASAALVELLRNQRKEDRLSIRELERKVLLAEISLAAYQTREENQTRYAAELETEGNTDQLTQVLNPKGFAKAVQNELIKNGKKGIYILIDANEFKPINDNLGHPAGNRALQALAKALKDIIGDKGVVGRLGGDEFGAFVSADEVNNELLEKIKDLFPKNGFSDPYVKSEFMKNLDSNETQTLTASVGMAMVENSDDLNATIERADSDMYKSKAKGKRRE